jgi:hypothetical protein
MITATETEEKALIERLEWTLLLKGEVLFVHMMVNGVSSYPVSDVMKYLARAGNSPVPANRRVA